MFERFVGALRASAAAIARIFEVFNAKIARLSTEKLRKFGAKTAQHTRRTRAEALTMRRTTCDTRLCLLRIFCRCWVRVLRKKMRRKSSKLSRFQAQIVKFFRCFSSNTSYGSQGQLQDMRNMHSMIVRAFCRRSACICGCDRADFRSFQRKNRAVFDRKTAQVWCKTSAPHARDARRSRNYA